MSQKVRRFTSVVTMPANVHNFVVDIPGLGENGDALNMVVESTTIPTYQFRTITLHYQGEEITYPGLPEGDKTWAVTIPEADNAVFYEVIRALYNEMYDEKTGIMKRCKLRDIVVHSRDLRDNPNFHVIMHGAWFKGRDILELNNSDPSAVMKHKLNFQFHWLEHPEKDAREGSVDPNS